MRLNCAHTYWISIVTLTTLLWVSAMTPVSNLLNFLPMSSLITAQVQTSNVSSSDEMHHDAMMKERSSSEHQAGVHCSGDCQMSASNHQMMDQCGEQLCQSVGCASIAALIPLSQLMFAQKSSMALILAQRPSKLISAPQSLFRPPIIA